MQEQSYSVKEVSVILDIPLRVVKEHIRDGKIKVTPRGSWVRRIKESEVMRLRELLHYRDQAEINAHIHNEA
jgi:predicted site-specific integrase-resolvase